MTIPAKMVDTGAPLLPILFNDDLQWIARVALLAIPSVAGSSILLFGVLHKGIQVLLPITLFVFYLAMAYRYEVMVRPKTKWSDEVVLITGGESGCGTKDFGRATGLGKILGDKLRARGAKVVVLTNVLPAGYKDAPGVLTITCDVTLRSEVKMAAERVRREVGAPTVLVNNAGVVKGKLLLDLTEQDVRSTFDVNTIAPFWMIQEFLPDMLYKRHGHVVNVASVMGVVAVSQMADYNASKAASIMMHGCLRNELDYRYKSPEIRTTLVLPGHLKTALFAETVMPSTWHGRLLTPSLAPESVADAVVGALDGGPMSSTDTVIRMPLVTQSARVWGPASGLLPGPVLRFGHWLSGAEWAMKPYGPRPDAGERIVTARKTKTKTW